MTRLNFLTPEEIKISSEFKKNGFIIRDGANKKSLNWIQSKFVNLIKKEYNFEKNITNLKILNFIHKKEIYLHIKAHKLSIGDYYQTQFPRYDLYSKELIKFKILMLYKFSVYFGGGTFFLFNQVNLSLSNK